MMNYKPLDFSGLPLFRAHMTNRYGFDSSSVVRWEVLNHGIFGVPSVVWGLRSELMCLRSSFHFVFHVSLNMIPRIWLPPFRLPLSSSSPVTCHDYIQWCGDLWYFYVPVCRHKKKYPDTEIKYNTSTIVPNPGLYPHRWNHGLNPQFI